MKYLRFLSLISPKLHTKILFLFIFKRWLFLSKSKVKTLNEKIQWLKFNEYHKNIYTKCADKYLAREYVAEKGCSEILNPLIANYNNFEEIDFDKLPEKFALKCNHGAGFNIIVEDKNQLDRKNIKLKLDDWMKTDFSLFSAEPHYKKIPRKIICEEFLVNELGQFPDDYKFYCFDGVPKYVMLCQGRKNAETKFYYFDMDWNLAPLSNDSLDAINQNIKIEKPIAFDEMKKYAYKLSSDFKFVRTDFYHVNGKVIFGELTFTPSAGLDRDRLKKTDLLLGNLLNLG
ncbi:ATP-grasp fold amidoligase family protein [Acinetobacter sp. YH16056_T]|uniref:ATP-grasp fold amidoligase family protein n=1 Tax=Acinetobacter sp. YH16056_T TaxID=2929514 RepID=UPI0015D408AF|nr:ATP-grasp fold amidoligase family protein [Acinetobacter sp. YH16056_T]UUS60877.1 hypothetical protein MST17_00415 [Acinetobacter sp. YH16056_T]